MLTRHDDLETGRRNVELQSGFKRLERHHDAAFVLQNRCSLTARDGETSGKGKIFSREVTGDFKLYTLPWASTLAIPAAPTDTP